jgi:hypothetical protein
VLVQVPSFSHGNSSAQKSAHKERDFTRILSVHRIKIYHVKYIQLLDRDQLLAADNYNCKMTALIYVDMKNHYVAVN